MKIKTDFITNSSTTCFIIIIDDDATFTEDIFLKSIGVDKDSDFSDIFSSLYKKLKSSIEPFDEACESHRWNKKRDNEDFVKKILDKDSWIKIEEARSSGKKIYFGNLSSDVDDIESFFCMSSFKIEADTFFIDATNDGW
jgi:hypothetical protein